MAHRIAQNPAVLTVFIAFAYWLTGELGQLLAIPPGDVTILWPPSGIALGTVLILGHRALAGIFVGAVLVNLPAAVSEFTIASLLLSSGIAVGSTLQAWIANWLLQRAGLRDNPFASAHRWARFLGLIVIASVTSSTCGALLLAANDSLDAGLLFTWSTWWFGDALGIAVFAPIVFLLFKRRQLGASSPLVLLTLIMTIVAMSTMAISIVLSYNTYIDSEHEQMLELVTSQSSLMEAVAAFDAQFSDDDAAGGWREATLGQIQVAMQNYNSYRASAQYLLARNDNGTIEFVMSKQAPLEDLPRGLPVGGELAVPMSLALDRQTGTTIALDYKGDEVLAAYTYLESLELGFVVYSLLSEIRQPFLLDGAVTLLVTLALVLLGIYLFHRVSSPLAQILERKSLELQRLVNEQTEELQQSETQFRQLMESAPDAMLMVDEEGLIRMSNRQLSALTGYNAAEIIGQPIEILVPESRRGIHKQHRDNYMDNPEARSLNRDKNLYCLRKDGSSFPVDIALSPIRTGVEKLVAASMRDTTQRDAYEESLRKNEARLEQALRSGNMEAWEMDFESNVAHSSLYLYEKFGYSAESVAEGQDPWPQIIVPEDRDKLGTELQKLRRGEKQQYLERYRVLAKDGSLRCVESTARPLRYGVDGKVNAIIGTRIDVTDRIESDSLLQEKLAELEEFNKLATGRELRMIELKKEINVLRERLNISERYEIVE